MSTAHAFSSPEAYAEPAASGGGGGRYFTGSPADGYGCDVCHSSQQGQRAFPLYVTGLAMTGFKAAEARQIVLSWPEFSARWQELRPDPAQPMAAGADAPSMSVVAELVAESGKGAGTIEIDVAKAGPNELCETTRPNLKPRLAAKLFQVRRGVPPLLIQPDDKGVMRCEAHQLGQRCVIALTSCGAKETRFAWIAPVQSEGPVWFSAGFVASEALSGTPEGDAVSVVTFPMLEKATKGEVYESTLRSGCSASSARGGGARAAGGVGSLLALMWVTRVRRRRQVHA